MDSHRFDVVVRQAAEEGGSRRRLLRGLIGAVAAVGITLLPAAGTDAKTIRGRCPKDPDEVRGYCTNFCSKNLRGYPGKYVRDCRKECITGCGQYARKKDR